MRRDRRKILAEIVTGAVVALPPYGDEVLGLALGGAVLKGKQMEDTTSDSREPRRRSAAPSQNVTVWVGVIVIGAVLVLAFTAGSLKSLVQH
jgi:hypothetical protein